MKPSPTPHSASIYREAALRMETRGTEYGTGEYDWSCTAIMGATKHKKEVFQPLCDAYVDMFAHGLEKRYVMETELQYAFSACENARDVRILALCFMAEITERP